MWWRRPFVPKKWDVFLSYSHRDCLWASAFFGIFRFACGEVFLDYVALQRGDAWKPIAETGIAQCDIFVLLESSDARESESVQYEVRCRQRTYSKSRREWRDREVRAEIRTTGDIDVDAEIQKRVSTIWNNPGFPSSIIKGSSYFQRDTGSITIAIPDGPHPGAKYEPPAGIASESIGNIQGWLSVNLPALEKLAERLGLPCPPREVLDQNMREYLEWAAGGHKPLHNIARRVLNEHLLERAKTGDSDKVRRLLHLGADIEAGTDDGGTALVLSAAGGHTETVQVLLCAGANTKARGSQWRTALIQAARAGHLKTVGELIAHTNDDLNLSDKADMTAIMWATKNGHVPVVCALVKAGADVNATDANGQTALDRARKKRLAAIKKILESAGARQ
jgi:hypothetical protein